MGGIMDVVRAEFSSNPRAESPQHAPVQARELVDRMLAATNALKQAHREAALVKEWL